MVRRGRFNPRQPRDRQGRWTSKGNATNSSKYARRGAAIGAAVGTLVHQQISGGRNPVTSIRVGGGIGAALGTVVGQNIDAIRTMRDIKVKQRARRG